MTAANNVREALERLIELEASNPQGVDYADLMLGCRMLVRTHGPALLASLSATAAGDAKDGYFVWHQGSPRSFWGEEWFIAKLDDGDHVVLRSLPEEWTYDFTTADHTYYKAARIKQWMQFDTSQYKPFTAQESP